MKEMFKDAWNYLIHKSNPFEKILAGAVLTVVVLTPFAINSEKKEDKFSNKFDFVIKHKPSLECGKSSFPADSYIIYEKSGEEGVFYVRFKEVEENQSLSKVKLEDCNAIKTY